MMSSYSRRASQGCAAACAVAAPNRAHDARNVPNIPILRNTRTLLSMDRSICVYCASSQKCDPIYHDAARQLGETLARAGYTIIYGGGALGSMGALAEGALARGGR